MQTHYDDRASPFDRTDSVNKRIFNEFNSEKQLGRDGCPFIVVVVVIFFSFARFFLFIIIFCVKCASETWRAEYYTYMLSDDNHRPNIPGYARRSHNMNYTKTCFFCRLVAGFFYFIYNIRNTQIVSVL